MRMHPRFLKKKGFYVKQASTNNDIINFSEIALKKNVNVAQNISLYFADVISYLTFHTSV